MLKAITNYLQNQPYQNSGPVANEKVAATKDVRNDKLEEQALPEDISLSQRREYLEFLSGHFDVTNMSNSEMNQLQSLLTEYGFINNNDLNSMRSLSLAKQLTQPNDAINALDMLNQVKDHYQELEIPYSTQQQFEKVRVTIENMASARTQLAS